MQIKRLHEEKYHEKASVETHVIQLEKNYKHLREENSHLVEELNQMHHLVKDYETDKCKLEKKLKKFINKTITERRNSIRIFDKSIQEKVNKSVI